MRKLLSMGACAALLLAGAACNDFLKPNPTDTLTSANFYKTSQDALALFGSARDWFKQGNYEIALQQANDALTKTPSDTALHEFRALCLFALGRYGEAATHFAHAAGVFPPNSAYENKRISFLRKEASALYQQGDELGDNSALLSPIEQSSWF